MSTSGESADLKLKNSIVEEIEWTAGVDPVHLGIFVTDGAVAISGEVETFPERELAEKAVLRVPGVFAFADEITVRGARGPGTDADLARDVARALRNAEGVPVDVKAVVHRHVVTLTGSVDRQDQRQAARHAVVGLAGAEAVVNNVEIRPTATTTQTRQAITAALARRAQIQAECISVTLDSRGVVTLSGTVDSLQERSDVEHAAWAAPGVTGVNDRLRIAR
jgi:osmotically-inducible protein OsmY